MSSLETNGSPQLELTREFILGIETGDMNKAGETMHKDYRRFTYPRSVGKPAQTKEEYLQHTGELANLWAGERKVSHVCLFPISFAPG